MHVEIFLEEPSAEAFLEGFFPRVLPDATFQAHVFQGKSDLLNKLEPRLRAYKTWIPEDWRLVVLVDRDDDDCKELKNQLEAISRRAGFPTRTRRKEGRFVLLNRIAIEELEAWFFGAPDILAMAYPGVPASLGKKAKYRDPDGISGGTWEALERVLQAAGHYQAGIGKIEIAREMGRLLPVLNNSSHSFNTFVSALRDFA